MDAEKTVKTGQQASPEKQETEKEAGRPFFYDAVVLGAGKGERAGLGYNKVLFALPTGKTVFETALEPYLQDAQCRTIIAVCAPYEKETFAYLLEGYEKVRIACGGATRQQSVWNALQQTGSDYVLIHDGARPFASSALIERIKTALQTDPAAIPVLPMVDSLVRLDESGQYVQQTPPRSQFARVQTPQGFARNVILQAHQTALKSGFEGTDDASLVLAASLGKVQCVPGEEANQKITSPEDLKICRNS